MKLYELKWYMSRNFILDTDIVLYFLEEEKDLLPVILELHDLSTYFRCYAFYRTKGNVLKCQLATIEEGYRWEIIFDDIPVLTFDFGMGMLNQEFHAILPSHPLQRLGNLSDATFDMFIEYVTPRLPTKGFKLTVKDGV